MELSQYVLEALREGREFDLYRGRQPGNAVPILVLAPGRAQQVPAAVSRLENEYALAGELDPAWALRPLALVRHAGRVMLVFADHGGEPLDAMLGRPLGLNRFLQIGAGLAAALRQVHRHGLIHKDIKPENVLVDDAGNVRLTGFGIASRLMRERQSPAPPQVIAGTLAYMAPEQTGRMNRSIDVRSDLYSLGVTLYEMLTGTLPFTASDPMEWIHCHIARKPVPPGERVGRLPAQIEAIVMKLLAKNAEDRYQTAAGVEADLQRCRVAWEAQRHIEPFAPGECDKPDRLMMPERLYGRDAEVDLLVAAFDRAATRGRTEFVLVSGYSGIGKSSLVNELDKVVVRSRGMFAAGKFDQYQRNIPYATLAQAFQGLVRQLLGKSNAELDRWRSELLAALEPNGQLMVTLIPELAHIIGEQPPVPELAPQDAQRRFHMVFLRFLGVFARPEHPLALFLDDLQWLDAATLELLERLATAADARHLMLIGAYRENEVSPAHPLMRTLDAIRNGGANVSQIALGPLTPGDVVRFVADALHADPEHVRPLAGLVIEKTAGNPFFVIQFVTTLAEDGLLTFDSAGSAWQWDVNRIRATGMTDNVAELVAAKLGRLPADAREVLGQLACLGNAAEIGTLSLVHGGSEEQIHAALRETARAGLVFSMNGACTFLHDRVQEAAYALIPERERAAVHLRIGRLLMSRTAPAQIEERIFEIVNQLDRGAALIHSPAERTQVAELNLMAGKRAKSSTAYASALAYFAAGRALLEQRTSARQERLAFELELQRAECEFMTGEVAAAEDRLLALQERAADRAELAAVVCLAVLLYFTTGRSELAAGTALKFLERGGIAWSPHPTDDEVRQEHRRMLHLLAKRPIESLVDLPAMTDAGCMANLDVLTELFPAAFYVDRNLLELVLLRMTNLSLEHGHADGSCVAYAALNMVLGPRFGDYQVAYRLGRLACDLVDRRGLDRYKARVYSCVGSFAMPWTRHLPACRPLLRLAFDAGNAAGDLAFAAYTFRHLVTNLLISGEPLGEVQLEAEQALAIARKARLGVPAERFIGQLGLIRALRGVGPDADRSAGLEQGDAWFGQDLETQPHLAMAACFHWIFQLEQHFFAGDYAAGIEAAAHAARLLWSTRSCFEEADYHFYAALTQAAACDRASTEQRQRHIEALLDHHRQITAWSENCPENFANRAELIRAEIARLEGREMEAMRLYDLAIALARKDGFIQNEGLANELAARFYAVRGFETIATAYLRNARSCYILWGAAGKVRQLDEGHPDVRERPLPFTPTATIGAPIEHLDVGAMFKASQALSSEIVLGSLIDSLMRITVEHAGAERAILVLLRSGEAQLAAEAATVQGRVEVSRREEAVSSANLPEAALHYVIRTRESLILDDASASPLLAGDEYVRRCRPKSVLCVPIVKQAKLIGALYLENNLTPHAFTLERITMLEFLASQAAISLENAYLYADLQRSEAFLVEGQRMSCTGSWHWNIPTGNVVWSEEHFRIFDCDPMQGPVPNFQVFLERVHPEDRAPVQQVIEASIRNRSEFSFDFRVALPDGTIKHLHGAGRPLVDESGEVRDYVGSTMDVSERKRSEDALRDAQAELAHVARLTTMGELVASIAHEVNQPLAAIAANAEACLRWLAKEPPDLDRARKTAERIVRDGHQAGDVIRSIRNMLLKSSPESEPLDIDAAIRDVLDLMRGEMRRYEVALELELDGALESVMGDRVQLQQVIVNLVKNGIEAMSTVTDRTRVLRVSTRADGNGYALVAVEDTGAGIEPEKMARIFDPFFTTKREGMGMGLSICRSIVEAHGGSLKAMPRSPQGSVFQFSLPMCG